MVSIYPEKERKHFDLPPEGWVISPMKKRRHSTTASILALIILVIMLVAALVLAKVTSVSLTWPMIFGRVNTTVPVIRHDIKGFVVADINDSNENTLYYLLRFYDGAGNRVSRQIAVATTSVAIADDGTMSVQIIDDAHTATGTPYASALIYDRNPDPTDVPLNPVHVGDPCIVYAHVIVCNTFPLNVDVSSFSTTTDATSTPAASSTSKENKVKGISISIAPETHILADAVGGGTGIHTRPPTTSTPPKNTPPQKTKDPQPKPKAAPHKKPATSHRKPQKDKGDTPSTPPGDYPEQNPDYNPDTNNDQSTPPGDFAPADYYPEPGSSDEKPGDFTPPPPNSDVTIPENTPENNQADNSGHCPGEQWCDTTPPTERDNTPTPTTNPSGRPDEPQVLTKDTGSGADNGGLNMTDNPFNNL